MTHTHRAIYKRKEDLYVGGDLKHYLPQIDFVLKMSFP